ncbi:MAG: hypothetical protein M1815_002316, partial [Lichina confinis]
MSREKQRRDIFRTSKKGVGINRRHVPSDERYKPWAAESTVGRDYRPKQKAPTGAEAVVRVWKVGRIAMSGNSPLLRSTDVLVQSSTGPGPTQNRPRTVPYQVDGSHDDLGGNDVGLDEGSSSYCCV